MFLKFAIYMGFCLVAGQDIEVKGEPEKGPEVSVTGTDQLVLPGTLESAQDGFFGLQSAYFSEALSIPAERVISVAFKKGRGRAQESREAFYFRLRGNQVLYGDLLGVSAEGWEIAADGLGNVVIPKLLLERVQWLQNPNLVYSGPRGKSGWDLNRDWVFQNQRLISLEPKARLTRDFGLDQERTLAFQLHWELDMPRFRLILGSDTKRSRAKGVTLTMMGEDLYATSIVDEELQLLQLSDGLPADKTFSIRARITSELIVFLDGEDQVIGQLERGGNSGEHFVLLNDGFDLELSDVVVIEGGEGGETLPGRLQAEGVLSFDREAGIFETAEGPVPLESLLGVDFAEAAQPFVRPTKGIDLTYRDGRHVHGGFVRLQNDGIVLQFPWEAGERVCSVAGLVSIETMDSELKAKKSRQPSSYLVAGKKHLGGELINVDEQGQITWKLSMCDEVLTLSREKFDALRLNKVTAYFASNKKAPHRFHLRSGETFRGKIQSIDPDGLVYSTADGKPGRLVIDRIKAVEFNRKKMRDFRRLLEKKNKPQSGMHFFGGGGGGEEIRRETSHGLDRTSLERALTLPRKYKDRPFANLIVARTGDFLRTNVISFEPGSVSYPGTGAGTRKLADKHVAAIVWLSEEETPELPDGAVLVRLDRDVRLIAQLVGMEDGKLLLHSEIHGELRISRKHILEIELNPKREDLEDLYDDWVLHPMKEPFLEVESAAPGTDSVEGATAPTDGSDAEDVDEPIVIPIEVPLEASILEPLEEPQRED